MLVNQSGSDVRTPLVGHTPLFLFAGFHVLLALLTPENQFGLHGVDVFLNVVKVLCQKLGAAAHGLDGGADALRFPRHCLSLLLQGHFRLYVLEVEKLYTAAEDLQMCFKRLLIAVMLKFPKLLMSRHKNSQLYEHRKSRACPLTKKQNKPASRILPLPAESQTGKT